MDVRNGPDGIQFLPSRSDQWAIAEALPGVIVRQEAMRRGYIPITAGAAALHNTMGQEQPDSDDDRVEHVLTEGEKNRQALEREARSLLNPEVELSAPEQLWASERLWKTILGYIPPYLAPGQMRHLESVLSEPSNAGMRAIWSPFLTPDQLRLAAESACRRLSNVTCDADADALALIDPENSMYLDLLRKPETDITESALGSDFGLRYHTPDGELLKQSDYLSAMLQAGLAIEKNGIVWMLSVVDVRYMGRRTDLPDQRANTQPQQLHASGDPTVTLSTVLAIQFLHQMNGTPTDGANWHMDTANGAVYRLTEGQARSEKALVEIPVISSAQLPGEPHPERFFLRPLDMWRNGSSAIERLDYRAAVSGL